MPSFSDNVCSRCHCHVPFWFLAMVWFQHQYRAEMLLPEQAQPGTCIPLPADTWVA